MVGNLIITHTKTIKMKTLAFNFLFPVFLLVSGVVNAQTAGLGQKSFVLFGVSPAQASVLSEMEPILKADSGFEMVRVDYSRNSVYVVSQTGVLVNSAYLQNILGNNFQYVTCSQYGVYGYDEVNFNALFNCLAQ